MRFWTRADFGRTGRVKRRMQRNRSERLPPRQAAGRDRGGFSRCSASASRVRSDLVLPGEAAFAAGAQAGEVSGAEGIGGEQSVQVASLHPPVGGDCSFGPARQPQHGPRQPRALGASDMHLVAVHRRPRSQVATRHLDQRLLAAEFGLERRAGRDPSTSPGGPSMPSGSLIRVPSI